MRCLYKGCLRPAVRKIREDGLCVKHRKKPLTHIERRITDYLSAGGLFNPECMEHEKVRDLLLDVRDNNERDKRIPPLLRHGRRQSHNYG